MNSGGDGKKSRSKTAAYGETDAEPRYKEKPQQNCGIRRNCSGTAAYGETDVERRHTKKPQGD